MITTGRKVLEAMPALRELMWAKWSLADAYKIAVLARKVQEAGMIVDARRVELVKKYAGPAAPGQDVHVPDDKMAEFRAEFDALVAEPLTLEATRVCVADSEANRKTSVSPEGLLALEDFLDLSAIVPAD